jgi:DNA-binding NtrC family response regulator
VDTDPGTRKLAAFMLQKRGYRVLEARSTADAILLYKSTDARADLLLTEVLMPRMSGTELAQQLVALQPQLRVLYMSHADARRITRHAEIDCARGFLQKPFTMDRLTEKVRQALDAPHGRAAAS